MADNTGDERLEIGGGRYDQIMTRLRPDTRRSMPDLNDVFTTKRGIGSSGPEMEKEEEKFCPTKHLFCIHTIESTDIIKIERFQTVLQCRNTMLQ